MKFDDNMYYFSTQLKQYLDICHAHFRLLKLNKTELQVLFESKSFRFWCAL